MKIRYTWCRNDLMKILEKPIREIGVSGIAKVLNLSLPHTSNLLAGRRKLTYKQIITLVEKFNLNRDDFEKMLIFNLSKDKLRLAKLLNDSKLSDEYYALKLYYNMGI